MVSTLILHLAETTSRRQGRRGRERIDSGAELRMFPGWPPRRSLPTAQALQAQEQGLDLVWFFARIVPPVAKAVDFGHYQYSSKKTAPRENSTWCR
jgi:hypothetical protein